MKPSFTDSHHRVISLFKTLIKYGFWIASVIAIPLAIWLSWVYVSTFWSKSWHDTDAWVDAGDALGGLLGSLFGAFGFIALLYTVHMQKDELVATRQQLAESTEAQKQMERTQRITRFEGLFGQQMRQLNHLHDTIKDDEIASCYQTIMTLGDDFPAIKTHINQNHELVRFFLFLYQVLKLINDSHFGDDTAPTDEDNDSQYRYANIVRASIDDRILRLFCLICAKIDDDHPDADLLNYHRQRGYAMRFELFEHIDYRYDGVAIPMLQAIFDDRIHAIDRYEFTKDGKSAFGDSRYIKYYQKHWEQP